MSATRAPKRCPIHRITHTGRCPVCATRTAARRAKRYGSDHKAARREWAPLVAAGFVECARCGVHIEPGERWALDHKDDGSGDYLGPSHKRCNDSAGGRLAHDWL
jgi:hypothetical protein